MTKNGNTDTIVKKRGRKSKKQLEEEMKTANIVSGNISIKIEETQIVNHDDTNAITTTNTTTTNTNTTNTNTNLIEHVVNSDDSDNDHDNENNVLLNANQPPSSTSESKPIGKKRGRKPKGGKIIQQIVPLVNNKETKPNVILHLRCSLKDLISNNSSGSSLEGFTFSNSNNLSYDIINSENNHFNEFINISSKLAEYEADNDTNDCDITNKDIDIRDIWKKLKNLEHNLHINNTDNKKSACFWDTCEFDNPPVYIPKHFINDTYQVYGCFCSPECAVAYLMEENIDSSVKFERYQLVNHIYSKIYNYNKNIKPAPNPYYMLEKYYGNLNIQEFRSLLRNERLFLVVDKPLTRVMPELHEDNDDFIINNKIIPTNNIKLRKIQKKQTKTNILNERFGLVQN
jgi:hypothetical protein